jgi:hypothetical protein
MPIRSGIDLKVQVAYMVLEFGLTAAKYTGLAGHENGHMHHFSNCEQKSKFSLGAGCATGGSLMGSQDSNGDQGNQPTAPTLCDIFWWGVYSQM